MKAITLNTAAASNAGSRIASGTTVTVGSKPDQIDAERAKALLADGSAAEAPAPTPAPAPAPSAK